MHELSITEEILRIVTTHAQQAGVARVTDIYLVIGDLTSFIDDSIQFYFELLSPGTLAEGAALHFRRIKTRFRCRRCGQEFEPEGHNWTCPACGALGGDVTAGKEFYVESIEVIDKITGTEEAALGDR
ncbi:MAG TPA: hydrogenase maturation nickel metallochaperone HypA [Anaerolineae bacterium]|nr:hydrogenase maturation nickel metallochaperone HypA [Anaerolineae bacterium]HQK13398.1 hydrogenase maturation nickel metallochaperone HypA [Anaerolineae bacterium]